MHKQVGMGIVVKSGSLCGVMVSTLARNASDVGSIPALSTIFPIFITTTTIGNICNIYIICVQYSPYASIY